MPADADDCWIDLYQSSITLDAWNLTLYPDTDPVLMRDKPEYQINPYVKIFLLNKVYLPARRHKVQNLPEHFQVTAETTFNTKSFYGVGDGYKWGTGVEGGAYFITPDCGPDTTPSSRYFSQVGCWYACSEVAGARNWRPAAGCVGEKNYPPCAGAMGS